MKPPPKLTSILLGYAPGRVVAPDELEKIEELLQRAHETGSAAWPQVALEAEVFVRHLSRVLPKPDPGCSLEQSLKQALGKLDLPGLYLACACGHNVPRASDTLERDVLARLPTLLDPRMCATIIDEICQRVRIHLLLGTGEAGPQLTLYKGQGSLLNWIRVIATRMALRQVAPVRKTMEENDLAAIEALPTPGIDAEFDLIKRRCLREFRPAAREAFATLTPRQRYLLRLHFVDRLSTIELGRLYQVDQSTASRWLRDARQAVYEETKRRLKERLRLSSHEFDSILSDINSQLTLSLSQVLKEEEEEKLRQAVREAVAQLSGGQKELLRRHFVERRSLTDMSKLYNEDIPTVSSRLECARQAVYEETKRRLKDGFGSSPEFENRLGDIHIRVDLILYQILKEEKEGG